MGRAVAVFCIPGLGHFQPLRPLIADLSRTGFAVHVFTHRDFEPRVTSAGATFVDLFGRFPLAAADHESMPIPSRYVSYAAAYAEDLIREVGALRPALIVYETFSVIARAVALSLGIPFVSVTAGHALDPMPSIEALRGDPRVALSARCLRAVDVLRDRYGLSDASPFSYLAGLSPHLNLSVEPPSFVNAKERKAAEPIAFYGCLFPGQDWEAPPRQASLHFGGTARDLRIYVCFGTVSMAYYRSAALGVFRAVADSFGNASGVQILISLGGASLDDQDRRELERPNLRLVDFADQWAVLGEADVFFTHHGVNSTHEAVARLVPMVSYPFLGDQPAMAVTGRQLGIAVPLTEALRGSVTARDASAAVDKLLSERNVFRMNLARARDQELEVIAQRPKVLERLQALAQNSGRV